MLNLALVLVLMTGCRGLPQAEVRRTPGPKRAADSGIVVVAKPKQMLTSRHTKRVAPPDGAVCVALRAGYGAEGRLLALKAGYWR